LLLLHLLNTDGIHHRYGPQSPASYTALALADSFVARILQALDGAGIRTNTTIFVTADHGFATATNILQPNVLLRQAGLLQLNSSHQIAHARVQIVPEGGTGMLYFTDAQTPAADRQRVLELFAGKQGVKIIEPSQYAALGLPTSDQNPGAPDLLLAAEDGYAIAGDATGDEFLVHATLQTNLGYHGYLASDPHMQAPFIVSGRRIKRGTKLGLIDNLDLAPTIAELLGQHLPAAIGKPLREIFRD
jgi:predicted AlkP superfamily pyrophosphatase or phosphodiesterase